MNLLDKLTIGIKTYNRPSCLDNCLHHIRKLYPIIKIIVADDSNDKIKNLNKQLINNYNTNYTGNLIKLVDLPFDSGVSIGRNAIVDLVNTEYYLTLDDDNYLDKETKIIDILQFMEARPEIHLVGGICKDRQVIYGHNSHNYSYTFINIHKLDIYCCCNFIKLSDRMNIYKTNLVLNLFIAKTEILKKHPWNPELKFEEHKPFFVELYRNNINCAISYQLYFREITDIRRQYIESDSGYKKINHNQLYQLRIINSENLEKLQALTPK